VFPGWTLYIEYTTQKIAKTFPSGGGAGLDVGRGGKKLLRIRITAEVDGVKSDYTITYGWYGTNATLGFDVARADAPGGRMRRS